MYMLGTTAPLLLLYIHPKCITIMKVPLKIYLSKITDRAKGVWLKISHDN